MHAYNAHIIQTEPHPLSISENTTLLFYFFFIFFIYTRNTCTRLNFELIHQMSKLISTDPTQA